MLQVYRADNNTLVADYTYDAWGKILSATSYTADNLADINPFRYRGYHYDEETDFYYLQSRYYDPEIGRFINADGQISGVGGDILGYNQFAYCFNNPVNLSDHSGNWPSWGQVLTAVTGACIVALAVSAAITAAPVLVAAATVGYASGVIAAAGTIACSAAATICGASLIGEAITGENPVADLVGQENFDLITAISTAGASMGMDILSFSQGSSSTSTTTNTSRGSTGRTEPANLREKLAMEQVKSNPSAGTPLTKIPLNDPRWPSSEGWVKMQQLVPTSQGNINIHYVYNQTLKIYDDFKFTS